MRLCIHPVFSDPAHMMDIHINHVTFMFVYNVIPTRESFAESSLISRKYPAAIQFERDTRKIINFGNLALCDSLKNNFTLMKNLPNDPTIKSYIRCVLILTSLNFNPRKEICQIRWKKKIEATNDEADSTRYTSGSY